MIHIELMKQAHGNWGLGICFGGCLYNLQDSVGTKKNALSLKRKMLKESVSWDEKYKEDVLKEIIQRLQSVENS